MSRKEHGETGGLSRGEAIGIIVVLVMYVVSLLYSYTTQPELFAIQHLYFSLITFLLVVGILAFDRLTLESVRVDIHVVAACVIAAFAVFALVNFIVVTPVLLQVAALSSVIPLVGMATHHALFVGVGEGILHFTIIRLTKVVTGDWGRAILIGSAILGGLHVFAIGVVLPTLTFLALIFVVFAALAKLPELMGSKIGLSLIVAVVAHAVYNVSLLTLGTLVEAAVTMVAAVV